MVSVKWLVHSACTCMQTCMHECIMCMLNAVSLAPSSPPPPPPPSLYLSYSPTCTCTHSWKCSMTQVLEMPTLLRLAPPTLHSILHTTHLTHLTLLTSHSTHSSPHTPHLTHHTPHITLLTSHSSPHTSHSTHHTPHLTLHTPPLHTNMVFRSVRRCGRWR